MEDESFMANAITSYMPDMTTDLPFLGEVDIAPYALALAIFLGLLLFFQILQRIIIKRLLHKLTESTRTDIDNVIIKAVEEIRPWVYNVVAAYVALQLFELPTMLGYIITGVVFFAIVWQAIEVATKLIDFFTRRFVEKDEDGDGKVDPNSAMASNLITLMAKIVLWSLGLLFVLSNLGIEITSLIAGLGVGGVAVAFALQGILSDLFASFSIYFDKPFRIGDYIVVGGDDGVVEKIGIKTTRLRTLQGEELVVSNNELTTARVQNFKKMQERRIVTEFGITYETPHEKVEQIPGIVRRIFEHLEGGRIDRIHFTTFGDSALIFELVYHVESPDYVQYLDIQEQFNFELMQRFSENGIDFAYPTQTIYNKSIT